MILTTARYLSSTFNIVKSSIKGRSQQQNIIALPSKAHTLLTLSLLASLICTPLQAQAYADDDQDLIPNSQDTRTSTPFSCSGDLYMVNHGQLSTFNPITTLFEPIGSNTLGANGLGYNTNNHFAYGVYRGSLYLMDATGTTELVGTVTPKGGAQPATFPSELRSGVMVGGMLWGLSRSALGHVFKIDVAHRSYEAIALDAAFPNNHSIPGDITFYNNKLYAVNRGTLTTLDIGAPNNTQAPITKTTVVLSNDLIGDVFAGGQMMDGAGNLFATSNEGGFYQVLNYTTSTPSLLYLSTSPIGNLNDAFNCATNQCSTVDFDCDSNILIGDIDQDNDGITDLAESHGIQPLGDADGNGIPNFQDAKTNGSPTSPTCRDANNDTICDQLDRLFDADGDGLPNHLDKDSDNDGIPDSLESYPLSLDTNGDGILSTSEAGGTTNREAFGNNGFANRLEQSDALNALPVQTPQDTDSDGTPNFLDTDSDNDGISDLAELNNSALLMLDTDNDGAIDLINPVGNDGIPDSAQNHIDASPVSLKPLDTDGDGYTNERDDDSDNDGILDKIEYLNAAQNGASHWDTDRDGLPDTLDLDSDNDGLPDNIEAQITQQYIRPSSGTNSISSTGRNTAYNALTSGLIPTNTDNDALPDYLDLDSDNDTFHDTLEAALTLSMAVGRNGLDSNSEMTDDYRDTNGVINSPAQLPNINNMGDINVREANPASISINVVADDDIINMQEHNTSVTLNGTTVNVEDGQIVTITLNDQTYTATVNDNTWQTVLPSIAAQALGSGDTITASVSNRAGSTASPAIRPISHTTMSPRIALNTVAGDNTINSNEDDNPVILSGTTQYVESNQTVTLTLNNKTYTATVNNNQWQTTLPAQDAQALEASNALTATVSNAAGDTSTPARRTVLHTLTLPTLTLNTVAGDDVISTIEDDNPIALSGTTTAVEDGQAVTLSLNSKTYTATVTNNQWQTMLPAKDAQALGDTHVITARVSNAAGDIAPLASLTINHQILDLSDDDNDGIPNGIEGTDDFDGDGIPNHQDPDSDNDGIPDTQEGTLSQDNNNNGIDDAFEHGAQALDSDGDNSPDFLDIDSDNDGLPDAIEQSDNNRLTDTDGDGIPDFRDIDSDSDRIPDSWEVDGNPLMPPDDDQDGIPNHLDADSDGDSIADTLEAGLPIPYGKDANSNGLDDSLEVAFTGGVDINNDGIDDKAVPINTDGDEQPNYLDEDSDNDGISDAIESHHNDTPALTLEVKDTDNDGIIDALDIDQNPEALDNNNNGIIDSAEPVDSDNDGTPDYRDLDSDNDSISDQIESDIDTDGDDQPNYRDLDSDNDGLSDNSEAGLSINPNTGMIAGSPRQTDNDAIPDYLDQDSDNDGLLDSTEAGGSENQNNDRQKDTDNDSIPDYRDLDADNDGISDANEIAWLHQTDTDSDGLADTFDADADADGLIDSGKQDADGDGINDSVDADVNGMRQPDLDGNGISDFASQSDFDGDGIPDTLDIDSDNDGLPDLDEAGGFYRDTNGNGRINGQDSNNNGLVDSVESDLGGSALIPIDTDGDGLPDTHDLDSDGDGLTDLAEAGLSRLDPNGDGILGTGSFADNNTNGLGDLADPTNGGERAQFIDRDYDGKPDNQDLDSDADGLSDLIEAVGSDLADSLDPDLDGRVGSILTPSVDTNNNGISDILETSSNSLNTRALQDSNNNGISDVAEQYLQRIQIAPPSQPTNPETGRVDPNQADFDRDGYPDVIEVRYGGDPLNGAEDDDNGNGIPNWVENTDTNADGNNDSDKDGFADLFEQIIGTNPEVAEPIDTLFDAAIAQLLNNPRYLGRATSPVIWVDTQQGANPVINVARLGGGALLVGRIGNYHVFGDSRDPTTTPTYQWHFPNPALESVVIGSRTSAKLAFNPEPLNVGVYSAILSITLGGHTSVTQQLISIVEGSAQPDSDRDQLANPLDSFNANLGYLQHAQITSTYTLDADSPVFIGVGSGNFDNTWFSDQAVRVRVGQLGLSAQSLQSPSLTFKEGAGATLLNYTQFNAVISTLKQNTIAPTASPVDDGFDTQAIYDFEVTNLPYPGAQARVSIALATPIALGAQARHYSLLKGWQSFMTDGHNQIASSMRLSGSQHLCPPIGSNAYKPGLTEGHHCVQLTLLDGAENDADNNETATQEDGQGDVNGLIAHTFSLAKPTGAANSSLSSLSQSSTNNASSASSHNLISSTATSSADNSAGSSKRGRIETGVTGGAITLLHLGFLIGLLGIRWQLINRQCRIKPYIKHGINNCLGKHWAKGSTVKKRA